MGQPMSAGLNYIANIVHYSMWVFLLLGMEAIRTYRTNPYLIIGTHHIPTWTTPLLMIFVVAVLIPRTSFLGHLCGVAVGYLGMSPLLALSSLTFYLPRVYSWLGICQVPGTSRVGAPLDRVTPQPTCHLTSLCERRSEDVWPIWGAAIEQPTRQ